MSYQTDIDGNETYDLDAAGKKQVYKKSATTNAEVYAVTVQNKPFYARDQFKNEYYAKNSTGNEIYLKIDNEEVYAMYFKSSLNQYYAKKKVGQASVTEFYAKDRNRKEKFAVDADNCERYAKDASNEEIYFQTNPRYARFQNYEIYAQRNGVDTEIPGKYCKDDKGNEYYPKDINGNEKCILDNKGASIFAKLADGTSFYPVSFDNYILVPIDPGKKDAKFIPNNTTVNAANCLHKISPLMALTDVAKPPLDTISLITNTMGEFSWSTTIMLFQFIVIILLGIFLYWVRR